MKVLDDFMIAKEKIQFFIKTRFKRIKQAKMGKKNCRKLTAEYFQAGKFKTVIFAITMIYVSFKTLVTKE